MAVLMKLYSHSVKFYQQTIIQPIRHGLFPVCEFTSKSGDLLAKKSDNEIELPVMPKRPPGPFFLFVKEHFKFGNESAAMTVSKAAKEWKLLDGTAKQGYKDKYLNLLPEYERTKAEFLKNLTEQQKLAFALLKDKDKDKPGVRKLNQFYKETGRPNKGKSAATFFMQACVAKVRESGGKVPLMTEFSKTVGEQWKVLPEYEKQKYNEAAAADKDRYEKALKEWNDRLVREGLLVQYYFLLQSAGRSSSAALLDQLLRNKK